MKVGIIGAGFAESAAAQVIAQKRCGSYAFFQQKSTSLF